MTTATKITMVRVVLLPVFMVLMYLSGGEEGLWMWLSLAVFVIAFAITRYVSLGSLLGSAAFGVGFAVLHFGNWPIVAGGVFLGLLAIFMHRKNILRLVQGKETKTHLIHRDLNKQ